MRRGSKGKINFQPERHLASQESHIFLKSKRMGKTGQRASKCFIPDKRLRYRPFNKEAKERKISCFSWPVLTGCSLPSSRHWEATGKLQSAALVLQERWGPRLQSTAVALPDTALGLLHKKAHGHSSLAKSCFESVWYLLTEGKKLPEKALKSSGYHLLTRNPPSLEGICIPRPQRTAIVQHQPKHKTPGSATKPSLDQIKGFSWHSLFPL